MQFCFSCKNVFLRYIHVDTYKTGSFLIAVGLLYDYTSLYPLRYRSDIQIASNFSFLQTLLQGISSNMSLCRSARISPG